MLAALAVLTLLIWLYLLFARGGFWRFRQAIPACRLSGASRVAVVIPARNEAAFVAPAVASILNQDYPGPLRVLLVDDHSQDGTSEIALESARQCGRPELLTVLRAAPLPPGWTGKLWALSQGIREAAPFQPDFLLFTDADILHPPDGLSSLVALAESAPYHLVSKMVSLRCRTLAERALIPAFVFFFFKLYPPAWVADPRRSTAGAAGGCLLLRWSALSRIGGLQAIRGAVIDDCALARAVKQTGGRIWLGLAANTRSLRQYNTLRDAGLMISRTAYTQLHHSPLFLLATAAGMFVTYLLPPLLLLSPALPVAALVCALMLAAYTPALRFYRCSLLWAPLLPLIAAFYTAATIHSALRYYRGLGAPWKGRIQDPSAPSPPDSTM